MIERIIEIADTAAFLSLENNLLKIKIPEKGITTIPTTEIQCLILANPAITITGALMAELASNGVTVVISGPNRLPIAMQLPLDANYIQNERFRAQLSTSLPLQKRLWQIIIKEKIKNQGKLLQSLHGNDCNLLKLSNKVKSGDTDNLESRAAVIYWKNIFSVPFIRNRENNDNNILLNYGYAILRAMAARACCGAGLHPTIGINHHNRYNPYCLADDLMEPFRFVIDKKVAELNPENNVIPELTGELRKEILKALFEKIESSSGYRQISDLLKISAVQIAESYQNGNINLSY